MACAAWPRWSIDVVEGNNDVDLVIGVVVNKLALGAEQMESPEASYTLSSRGMKLSSGFSRIPRFASG